MKLVGVIITGNAEKTIRRAVAALMPLVDAILILDTGVTDGTITNARDEARDYQNGRVHVEQWAWRNDFAAARNEVLRLARKRMNADWALMLDSDEFLTGLAAADADALRGFIVEAEDNEAYAIQIPHVTRTYQQPRIFYLPRRGSFKGRVHEAYEYGGPRLVVPGLFFGDDPKTPEQFKAKFERDYLALTEETKAHPREQRWWYYLGDTCVNLGKIDEALVAFEQCIQAHGWDEEGAWAAWRAACIREAQGAPDSRQRALELCVRGLQRHPGIGELAWLAGYCCEKQGRYLHALAWGLQAIQLGEAEGAAKEMQRVYFRSPKHLWELPYNLVRHCYRALGRQEEAESYAALEADAQARREALEVA